MKEPCFPNGKSKIFRFLLRNFRCFHVLLLLLLLCLPSLSFLSRKGVAEVLILWQTEERRIHKHTCAHITNIHRSRAPIPEHLLCLLLSFFPYSSNTIQGKSDVSVLLRRAQVMEEMLHSSGLLVMTEKTQSVRSKIVHNFPLSRTDWHG